MSYEHRDVAFREWNAGVRAARAAYRANPFAGTRQFLLDEYVAGGPLARVYQLAYGGWVVE